MTGWCGVVATDLPGTVVLAANEYRGRPPFCWPTDAPDRGVVRACYPAYGMGNGGAPMLFLLVECKGGRLFEVASEQCRAPAAPPGTCEECGLLDKDEPSVRQRAALGRVLCNDCAAKAVA